MANSSINSMRPSCNKDALRRRDRLDHALEIRKLTDRCDHCFRKGVNARLAPR